MALEHGLRTVIKEAATNIAHKLSRVAIVSIKIDGEQVKMAVWMLQLTAYPY